MVNYKLIELEAVKIGANEEKIFLAPAIIVEGKYDKIKLSNFIGSLIIQTDGFRIFKDKEKRALIKSLAQKNGIVIITDSDTAGFKIRGFIKSIAKDCNIWHIYIPHIHGKESRKATPSKENLLGVEGMDISILKELLIKNGVLGDTKRSIAITKQDFYCDGLSGSSNSKNKRESLLKALNLPTYVSANALVEVTNQLLTYDEYKELVENISN